MLEFFCFITAVNPSLCMVYKLKFIMMCLYRKFVCLVFVMIHNFRYRLDILDCTYTEH